MDEKKKLVKMTKRSLSNSFENRRECMKGRQVVAFHHRVGRQIASKSRERAKPDISTEKGLVVYVC